MTKSPDCKSPKCVDGVSGYIETPRGGKIVLFCRTCYQHNFGKMHDKDYQLKAEIDNCSDSMGRD